MIETEDHSDEQRCDNAASDAPSGAAPEICDADAHDRAPSSDFAAALTARYERLSLLTLDLAEEAGEAAVNWSMVDRDNKIGRFERRIAAMSRAIWAHNQIERLRLGRGGSGVNRRPNAIDQRHANNIEQHEPVPPPGDDAFNCANGDSNVSRETQGDAEINRVRTINACTSGETCEASDEVNAVETPPAKDWPGDADLFGESSLFADEDFDEAALDAAIKRALRDGKRGEDALKAALGIEDEAAPTNVRAPP